MFPDRLAGLRLKVYEAIHHPCNPSGLGRQAGKLAAGIITDLQAAAGEQPTGEQKQWLGEAYLARGIASAMPRSPEALTYLAQGRACLAGNMRPSALGLLLMLDYTEGLVRLDRGQAGYMRPPDAQEVELALKLLLRVAGWLGSFPRLALWRARALSFAAQAAAQLGQMDKARQAAQESNKAYGQLETTCSDHARQGTNQTIIHNPRPPLPTVWLEFYYDFGDLLSVAAPAP